MDWLSATCCASGGWGLMGGKNTMHRRHNFHWILAGEKCLWELPHMSYNRSLSCLQWAILDFDVHDSCQDLHPLNWLWEMWLPLLLPDNDTWQHSFSFARNTLFFCSCLSLVLRNMFGQCFPCLLLFNRNIHIWNECYKQWHLISIVKHCMSSVGGLWRSRGEWVSASHSAIYWPSPACVWHGAPELHSLLS